MARDGKKTERFELRLTTEEKKMLVKKAAAAGMSAAALIISFIGSEKVGEAIGDQIAAKRK